MGNDEQKLEHQNNPEINNKNEEFRVPISEKVRILTIYK